MSGLDQAWADRVAAICAPVFDAAGVGFSAHRPQPEALLWEAEPGAFATRYPDSEIEDSYGEGWPPPCIDYWVYVHAETMTVELSVEGWNLWPEEHPVTGNAETDGARLARRFAEILRVRPPDEETSGR